MNFAKMVGKKINKVLPSEFSVAKMYYKIQFELNGHHLSNLELNLITYTAIVGYITTVSSKQKFIDRFKTTQGTVNNIVAKLKKRGILIKENGRVKVNSFLVEDFTKGLTLVINLRNGQDNKTDESGIGDIRGDNTQG